MATVFKQTLMLCETKTKTIFGKMRTNFSTFIVSELSVECSKKKTVEFYLPEFSFCFKKTDTIDEVLCSDFFFIHVFLSTT